MLLSDEKMSKFIDSLLHKEEIELGNSIKYKFYANRYHSLEEINYFQMERNLWMIYGDEEKCEIYLTLFDKMRKFVANILQVPGLSRLFSQHYYNIEWNMYTEPKFEKNRWSLYRIILFTKFVMPIWDMNCCGEQRDFSNRYLYQMLP